MSGAYPAPTQFNPEKSTGRDFLGQQSIIQYMADKCLPSFTNATKKVRYYSFWAWAFKMLEIHGKNLDDKQRWWYLLKLETALIVINRFIDSEIIGMPGVKGLRSLVDNIKDFTPDTMVQIYHETLRATSYDAVQYAPSLGTLNIVKKIGAQVTICGFGNELFEAFDSKIKTAAGYALLVSPKTKQIKWSHLLEMKDGFCLANVSEDEKKIIVRIIEQQTVSIGSAKKVSERIETTLLLLDIIRVQKIENHDDILIRLWNDDYKCPQQLAQIADGWKIIEARRFYQISIEAILSAFCQYLWSFKSQTGEFDEFSQDVTSSFKAIKQKDAQPFALIIESDAPLRQFIEAVKKYCAGDNLDEQALVALIGKHGNGKGFNYQLVQYGIILLLYIFLQFNPKFPTYCNETGGITPRVVYSSI